MTDNTGKGKGGRGVKAEYETVVVRIPAGIKKLVERQCAEYRLTGEVNAVITAELIQKYYEQATDTRDWTMFNRFINELRGSIVDP